MSKITKKDIKELREQYEHTKMSYEDSVDIIKGKIEVIEGMIRMLVELEKK